MIQFLQKYLGRIWIPIIWSLVIGILLAMPGNMLPSETHFSIPQFDKIVHIGLFGGFVSLWNLYLSNRPAIPAGKLLRQFFYIFILANIYGIGMEFVQKYFIPFRDFDTSDMVADMIGSGIAYGLSNLLLINLD